MEEYIRKLDAIRTALGTLEITSTRHNTEVVLGSMQTLDTVISGLCNMVATRKETEESEHGESDN